MILAIIQARMSSTRLPGKVLMQVLGKPLLGYLLDRLSRSKRIDKIIVATTTEKQDDAICEYVASQKFSFYRGSQDDVLGRYYHPAAQHKPEYVVRITADCPLIDPEICDELIDFYLKEKLDHACLSQRFAEGLDCDIFSFKTLENMYQNAKKKSEREHVCLFVHNNPQIFRTKELDKPRDDGKYRITVDEPQDLEVVKNIIENFSRAGSDFFNFQAIKKYLDQNPDVLRKKFANNQERRVNKISAR